MSYDKYICKSCNYRTNVFANMKKHCFAKNVVYLF